MKHNGIFVTGTGTDVGKTVVTRALTRILFHRGIDVVAIKPVESGVEELTSSDTAHLVAAAGGRYSEQSVNAYRFKKPVSPHLASALENTTIDGDRVSSFLENWLEKADVVLAEGAGGLLVPINNELTYADVVARTRYRLLIVAPDILGTINHTLLTIEAARARNIEICGVVLNRVQDPSLGNEKAIAHYGNVPIIGRLPCLQNTSNALDDDHLATQLAESLHIDALVQSRNVPH